MNESYKHFLSFNYAVKILFFVLFMCFILCVSTLIVIKKKEEKK